MDATALFDEIFAFPIGSIVTLKGSILCGQPSLGIIEEQILQRCHGGVQRQYRLRILPDGGATLLPEISLEKIKRDGE